MNLKGKTAIIPGASRAIGRAIARRFGEEGATLICPVFDWPDSIEEMQSEFEAAGYNFHITHCDLQNKEEVIELKKFTLEHCRKVDFLINNIERGGMPIVHGSYDLAHNSKQWDLEINTTLKSKWLLFHNIFPIMNTETSGGAVVNISSVAAMTGRSGPGAFFFNDGYSAANRAISSFTETWAREAAPNIRVNELMIGLVKHRHGEHTRGWETLTEKQQSEIQQSTLLQRTGSPQEIADAVYFLAVNATYMTGALLRMDGGLVLGHSEVPPMPPGILE